jgi:hypothetical protein
LYSRNWGGYVVTSNLLISQPIVVSVTASWTVPQITPTAEDTHSSAWVGIGGLQDRTLIQLGTEHDSINGTASYSAWYETLPDYLVSIEGMTISAGDHITASVAVLNREEKLFAIELIDQTTGQRFSKNVTYESSRLSAEWVVERPMVSDQITNLANYGSISFRDVEVQVGDKIGTIAAFPNYEIIMIDNQNNPLVDIAPLGNGGSAFTVHRLQDT